MKRNFYKVLLSVSIDKTFVIEEEFLQDVIMREQQNW